MNRRILIPVMAVMFLSLLTAMTCPYCGKEIIVELKKSAAVVPPPEPAPIPVTGWKSAFKLYPNIPVPKDWADASWTVVKDLNNAGKSLVVRGKHKVVYYRCFFTDFKPSGTGNSQAVLVRDSSNIVFYQCKFLDNGNWKSKTNRDIHGLAIVDGSSDIYIIDCVGNHNEGDSVQVNAYFTKNPSQIKRVFVVGNLFSQDRENAIDIKASTDVVVTGNTIGGYHISPDGYSGDGTAVVAGQEKAVRTWIFGNLIMDSSRGIRGSNSKSHTTYYIWDNKFRRIKHDSKDSKALTSQWSTGASIQFWYDAMIYAAGNTFEQCDKQVVMVKYGVKPTLVVDRAKILSDYKKVFGITYTKRNCNHRSK